MLAIAHLSLTGTICDEKVPSSVKLSNAHHCSNSASTIAPSAASLNEASFPHCSMSVAFYSCVFGTVRRDGRHESQHVDDQHQGIISVNCATCKYLPTFFTMKNKVAGRDLQ